MTIQASFPEEGHDGEIQIDGRLAKPEGTSSLTAWAGDPDLDQLAWVTLHSEWVSKPSAAFWHVMQTLTESSHWNRTIFSITPVAYEVLYGDDDTIVRSGSGAGPGYPPDHCRYHALRHLLRKTPAPIGGLGLASNFSVQRAIHDSQNSESEHDVNSRCYNAHEWTAQWKEKSRHVAVFGLCIPGHVVTSENPRALRYWPFQYPKVRCYRFVFDTDCDEMSMNGGGDSGKGEKVSGGTLHYQVVPLGEEVRSGRQFETLICHAKPAAMKMTTLIRKRMQHFDVELRQSTYVKRVHHDNILSEARFRRRYDAMKVKYSYWVDRWTECTDPVKFVYEEMSIAAYLCALWELEREEEGTDRLQTFVDCGCGNGFLVYLLISEGHEGIGIDLQKRDIWDLYPANVTASLRHEEMDPLSFDCSPFDWVIGNHSDELSPWLAVIAARGQPNLSDCEVCEAPKGTLDGGDLTIRVHRARPRVFILPCCFFDFDGKKVAFGRTRRTLGVSAPHGSGKYEQYYRWIAKIMRAFGFTVEYENLRIPSTKYVSLVGRYIQYEERVSEAVVEEMTSLLLLDARQSRMR